MISGTYRKTRVELAFISRPTRVHLAFTSRRPRVDLASGSGGLPPRSAPLRFGLVPDHKIPTLADQVAVGEQVGDVLAQQPHVALVGPHQASERGDRVTLADPDAPLVVGELEHLGGQGAHVEGQASKGALLDAEELAPGPAVELAH
jgi:hypothetical protein